MNISMIKANIQKEIWEYKKIFLYVPVVIAAILILAPIISYALSEPMVFQHTGSFDNIPEEQINELFTKLSFGFIAILFAPFLVVAFAVQLYYFTACLFDERRDNSVLFWRSLPVSDAQSIGVKMLVGAIILPGAFLLAATIIAIIYMLFAAMGGVTLTTGQEINLWSAFFSGGWISNILSFWVSLVLFAVWLFPVYAWFMLASMYAKKAPFLWAVLPVVLVLVVESIMVYHFKVMDPFFSKMLFNYFDTSANIAAFHSGTANYSKAIINLNLDKISALGVLLGAGFIFAAHWLRVNRSH